MNLVHALRDTDSFLASLSAPQKRSFKKCKRSLLRAFVAPNFAVKTLVDMVCFEYVMYLETKENRHVKNVKDLLSELDMTPKSKKAVEVSATLSQILSHIGDKHV